MSRRGRPTIHVRGTDGSYITMHEVGHRAPLRIIHLAAVNAAEWARVAQSFSEEGVRIPPNEEPHEGREAIESWLAGIEELTSYELTRDMVDGADGIAYVRGRYAITLRPVGAPAPISDQGDFLEVWRKESDGAWRIIEAIWNTRLPMST
jgi:ketosteroid isomerase-like protein